MKNKPHEYIRLSQFTLEGRPMLDIRWWKETKRGPQPTRNAVEIQMRMVTRLITALQNQHAKFSALEAKEPAEANG